MSYEQLLDELETLQKGYAPETDQQPMLPMQGAPEDDEAQEDEEGDELDPKLKEKKIQKQFAKSFTLVDENGVEAEAVDGTELVKSLQDEVSALAATAKSEKEDLTKSFGYLIDVIKTQGSQLKMLQDNFTHLANQGAGRKSVMMPDASMAKSMGPVSSETFMTKANAAFDAGRITGKDLTTCSVSLRIGEAIDANLINKIFAQ